MLRRRRGAPDSGQPDLPAVPPAVRAAVELGRGERLLAVARAGRAAIGHVWLLATTWRFAVVAEVGGSGRPQWVRPWHEVDAASWSREAAELTMSFVDGSRPVVFPLSQQAVFLAVLRERVQASVISAEQVTVPGVRRARAVLRQDLAAGEIVEQLVLGRGTRVTETMLVAARPAFDRLREEVGLPPSR